MFNNRKPIRFELRYAAPVFDILQVQMEID